MIGAIIGVVSAVASLAAQRKQSKAVGQANQQSAEMERIAKENFGLNKESYEALMKQYHSVVQPGADFNLATLEKKAMEELPQQEYAQYANDPQYRAASERMYQGAAYDPAMGRANEKVWGLLDAGKNPMQQGAINALWNQGVSGSPAYQAGMGEYSDVLSGKYLDPTSNPYLSGTYDIMADKITQSAEDQMQNVLNYFDNGGESWKSSSQLQEMLARKGSDYLDQLSNAATNLYGGAYNQERNRMMDMTRMAPTFQGMSEGGINNMLQAGNLETSLPLQMDLGLQQNYAQYGMGANQRDAATQMGVRQAALGDVNAANQVSFNNAMSQYQQPYNLGSWYTNLATQMQNAYPRYQNVNVQQSQPETNPNAYTNPVNSAMSGLQQGMAVGNVVQGAIGNYGGSSSPYVSPTGYGYGFMGR